MKAFIRPASLLVILTLLAGPVAAADKIPVENLNDLPVRTYALETPASELLASPDAFEAFAAKVETDLVSTLEKYDIQDATTLQNMYGTLQSLALLDGRHEEALALIEKIRALEEKEALRLTTGLNTQAIIAARAAGEEGSAAYREAYQAKLSELVMPLPWDVVQDRIEGLKGNAEILSVNFLDGLVQGQIDPIVAQSGELSADVADRLVGLYLARTLIVPLKAERIAVYQALIDANKVEKPNIWPAREITLEPGQDLSPVRIAIWDSGVDTDIFGEQLFTNPGETLNGEDDDGNGFVDDLHGLAFDLDGRYSPELLHPHGDQEGRVDAAMKHLKGLMDLQAAIDSPEASALKADLGAMKPAEVEDFITSLGFCGLYAHGTHVAGIAVRGNPYAEILVSRITFDYHSLPAPVTEEIATRHAQSYRDAVEYFRTHDVRLANMSWGWTFREIESSLEANGLGATAEERKEMADRIFTILSDGLYAALESTPEILYVSAAGNDDSDVEFDRVIPSAWTLPNLLIVGAVDQAGERTGFTSMGENVQVYANGFEVMSYVPGGKQMAMSGTSMASPNVANLAAKLIAVQPELTPTETIALIREGADALEEQPGLLRIHPQATLALLPARQSGK